VTEPQQQAKTDDLAAYRQILVEADHRASLGVVNETRQNLRELELLDTLTVEEGKAEQAS